MREASLQRTVSAYLGRADKLESTMANEYASNFGDVVKHAVLGAAIENERPVRYLESHGGRLDYDLAELTPGGRRCVGLPRGRRREPCTPGERVCQVASPLVGTADAAPA